MAPGKNLFLFIKIFLLLSLISLCNSEDDAEVGATLKTRPKYTELVRSQRVTSTTTTTEKSDEFQEDDEASSEEAEEDDIPQSNARQPPPVRSSARTKEYVEFIRPGATPRSKTTTTRAPKRKVDKNARAEGCNQCRYYCKQCKGAEEVTSGGVWGCCNHNCCGGRCSCQKVV